MRSLRGRLTLWLLAGMGLLLAAGGLLLDRAISARLLRGFDDALTEEAQALVMSAEQRADGAVWLEIAPGSMPQFEARESPHYFQIWRGDGAVVARSPSLGGRDLPRPAVVDGRPRLADLVLPDGRAGRRVEVRFHPQMEKDDEAGGPPAFISSPDTPPVVLAVARGRGELDSFLGSVHLTLVLGLLGLLAATAVLVRTALRLGLAPLDDLSRRLEAMNADSLGEPLAIPEVPAELVPTVERLDALLARLRESFERERTFSANLAHELRTPLAELRAVCEVALKWPDLRSALSSLEEARGIGLQMERVVVNLLALARYDGGQRSIFLSEVPLREVAAGCWSALAAEADARRMTFGLEVPEGLALLTDRDKLELILSNLFSNAIAHGTPGGRVVCSATAAGGEIALRIANPTSELTPADLPRLFDRFWRKDAARSGGQHAGLGLSLVAALCELLGFRREARLEDSRFEVILWGPSAGISQATAGSAGPKGVPMKAKSIFTALVFTGSLLMAGSLFAAPPRSDVPPDLAKQAKISLEQARATALAKVPHGEVRSEELEREHGKLIYSFDIAVPGKSGIQEVNVDAVNGKVLGVHHESAKAEKQEAAKEKKEKKPPVR